MADVRTLKAGFSSAGVAVPEGKLYTVDENMEATSVDLSKQGNIPAYALPETLGTAGQVLTVNAEGDGLEWTTPT